MLESGIFYFTLMCLFDFFGMSKSNEQKMSKEQKMSNEQRLGNHSFMLQNFLVVLKLELE